MSMEIGGGLLLSTIVILLALSGLSSAQEHSIGLRLSTGQTNTENSVRDFPSAVFDADFLTGDSRELIDLRQLGIYKPISVFLDESRNFLFVNAYEGTYKIKIVDLTKKAEIGTLPIDTPEADIGFHQNSGILYITAYEQKLDRFVTSIFDQRFNLLSHLPDKDFFLQQISASRDGATHYLFGFDGNTRRGSLLAFDIGAGKILSRQRVSELGLKERDGWVCGGGKGFLLMKYPRKETASRVWTIVRYDLGKKAISGRVENVPTADMFFIDSLSRLVAREKVLVPHGDKQIWEFTGKGFEYDLAGQRLLCEFAIEKDAELRDIRGKLFSRVGKNIEEVLACSARHPKAP